MVSTDIVWFAGLFEGEGCLRFNGKNSVVMSVNMTDEDIVRRCITATGVGYVLGAYKINPGKPVFYWQLTKSEEIIILLNKIMPLLGERRKARALLAIERLKLVRKNGYCHNNHLMSGDNLYISPKGSRQCRACNKAREKKRVRT